MNVHHELSTGEKALYNMTNDEMDAMLSEGIDTDIWVDAGDHRSAIKIKPIQVARRRRSKLSKLSKLSKRWITEFKQFVNNLQIPQSPV